MLSPNFLGNFIPRRLTELMSEIEAEMLARVAYYVRKYGRVTGTAEFLTLKAAQYELLHKDLARIVSKYSEKTAREITAVYATSAAKSIEADNRLISGAAKSGAFRPMTSVYSAFSASAMKQTLNAAVERAVSIQNLTNTKCLQSALSAFTRATDKAYLSIVSGGRTFDGAYRQAIDELAANGITVVEYTRDGKVLNFSVEGATRRNLITSVSQTVGKIQEQNLQRLGCNLVEVTSHAGARPSHARWQGGRYWLGAPVRGYGSLVDICGYGQADGLCGINCYHGFGPFFEGYSQAAYERDPAKRQLGIDNDKLYELNQKQRYFERAIKDAKKRLAVYEAAGMKTEATAAARLVRERQSRIREFLAENPLLKRDYIRERIA